MTEHYVLFRNGKVLFRNGKIALGPNCCCDPPPVPTCEWEEFNSAIVRPTVGGSSTASPVYIGDFGPLSYTVTDDHNGRELIAFPGRFNVSPRTSYSDGIGSLIYSVDTNELYERVGLGCSGGTLSNLPEADPTGVTSQLWYYHRWDLIFDGSICTQEAWVSESGQAWQNNHGTLTAITGSMNVLSKNPLHIIVEFTPIADRYPPDTACDVDDTGGGDVTVEITE